ncbi:MAG: DUF512 domain-containing protein [Candidatus Cloacimonetes bacterium]|nr:DUF512 domain-containing protein [Candidatus Cloacimonadota bacterium]
MAITVQSVLPKSLAASYGIKAGETLLSINGQEVRDFLDLEFLASDYELIMELETPSGESRELLIHRESGRALGIEPEPYKHRNCKNSCIFCFIDQMPPMLRDTLYGKDDDYLFSFVFGNYITLTNLSEADYQRIISQHISPLYVSLHSTNAELRQKMMRSAKPVDAMSVLKRLSKKGISFHVQIVCVPGYNDGEELHKSLCDLMQAKLNLLSIGVVPVGLTRFRERLTSLTPFNAENASQTLAIIDEARKQYSSTIIYPADEFFVLANQGIPEEEYYGEYPQLENGIGMLRLSMQNFRHKKRSLLKELRKKTANYLMLSSVSAYAFISQIASELNQRLESQSIRVQMIRNDYLGEHISVCGLITFSDIKNQLSAQADEILIFPSCIFNHNGETLDGADRLTVKSAWDNPILLIDPFFEDWDYL